MVQNLIGSLSYSVFIYPLFVFVAILMFLFLFWRAIKHELFDEVLMLDTAVVATVGALLMSRIFEFIFQYEKFSWSYSKLVFFNKYGGVDFWGGLIGAGLFAYFFLRSKKINFWYVADLAAAPIAFAQAIVALGKYIAVFADSRINIYLYYFLGYVSIFFVLKVLARKKRHFGFFICFYVVSISALNMILFNFREEKTYILKVVPYDLAAPAVFLIGAVCIWYLLSKRKLARDLKGFFGRLLLGILKLFRTLTNMDEADRVSKAIVLSPYLLVLRLGAFLKLVGKEIVKSFSEFLYVLGVKKLK
ncbi:MAG: prolipoprotein diacylglyceryl transferase [Candidatus Curtissbacteria bacterium]|nr:prolipoprotein diacylglyceryl transferase [Candidatus Curtissbacteria bacterium]